MAEVGREARGVSRKRDRALGVRHGFGRRNRSVNPSQPSDREGQRRPPRYQSVSVQTKVAGGGHRMTLALFAVLLAGLAYYGARGSLANFVLSWESAYDESRGSVSLIATASFLSIGLAQIVGGKLLERIAAWKVLAA
ncbi:MAG: hypothetical protein QOE98_890, partial [Gaiellaceae bacterium]|nr:hypothetical protein [Gaiellaceae bacterium]